MKGQKIFLRRKRLIFFVEKNKERCLKRQINSVENKTKEKSPLKETNLNLIKEEEEENLNQLGESKSKQYPRNGLISISNEVHKFIKNKKSAKGTDVTNYILEDLQKKGMKNLNFKNIQRRVYDAINVMCAVGLITKNKQEIKYSLHDEGDIDTLGFSNCLSCGKKSGVTKPFSDESSNIDTDKNNELKENLAQLRNLQKKLSKLYIQTQFYEKYIKLNTSHPERNLEEKLEFPFDIVEYDSSQPVKIKAKEDCSRYLIVSNSNLNHVTSYDVMRRLISKELLSRINSPTNSQVVISEGKKSTNEDSIIGAEECREISEEEEEEESENINNNQNYEPKKIKILNEDEQLNFDENIIEKGKENLNEEEDNSLNINTNLKIKSLLNKNKNQEKIEENKRNKLYNKIFNYLKDKVVYKDELEIKDKKSSNIFCDENMDINNNNINYKDEILASILENSNNKNINKDTESIFTNNVKKSNHIFKSFDDTENRQKKEDFSSFIDFKK